MPWSCAASFSGFIPLLDQSSLWMSRPPFECRLSRNGYSNLYLESLSCRRTIIGGRRHTHKIAISGQNPCVQLFNAPLGVVKDVHLTLSLPAMANFGCPIPPPTAAR